MELRRRSFLSAILVASAAPAIVRADSLMALCPVGRFMPFNRGVCILLPGDTLSVSFTADGKDHWYGYESISKAVTYYGMQQNPRTGLWAPV